MRIHHLTATAFGPFPDEIAVDFDALTAAGLFLIHGPTGAGKTSLLDAICFALFADVPGLRDKRGIVSDHAAPTATPSVELEFTCGTRRFRIHRSPAHARPKKRGTGTIEAPATVTLSELRSSTWTVVSTRNDEAAEVLNDVLGMGKEQFAKVAMLPQGEFAAFLTAKDDDRRALLEKLFDITRFADVEEWLVDERRASEATVSSLRSGIDTDLARLADVVAASGLAQESFDDGEAPAVDERTLDGRPALDPASPDAIRALLDATGIDLDAHVSEAMVALDAAVAAESAAATDAERARGVMALRDRARVARTTIADLDAVQEDISAARLTHDAASRAASVRGHVAAISREASELERARAAVGAASARARTMAPDACDPTTLLDDLRVHDDTLRELVRLEASRADRASLARGHLDAITAATAILETADADRAAVAARVSGAEVALADALEAEASRDGVEGTAEVACDRLRLARRVVEDELTVTRLVAHAADARSAAQDARDHEQDIVARRLSQMAAELAESLVDGQSCPVCGAHEHPAPAREGDRVGPSALDDARLQHAALSRAHQQSEAAAASAQALLTEALKVLDVDAARDLDLAGLAVEVESAERRRSTVRARADKRAASEKVLATARTEVQRLDAAVTTAQQALARATTMAEQAQQAEAADAAAAHALLEAHSECPCLSASEGTLAGRAATNTRTSVAGDAVPAIHTLVQAHQRLTTVAQTWDEALRRSDETLARFTSATEVGLAAAVEAGFASLDEASAAMVAPAALDRLRDRLHDHDRARASATAVLGDADVIAAESAPAPDLAELTSAAQQARSALLTAQSAQTEASAARRSFTAVRSRLVAGLDAAGPALMHHHRIKELADTFTGGGLNNTLRMRLTSFVLAARLDTVARLANERLRIMGDGRYTLEHTDRLAARGARSGLGLRVLDQWTGVSRETSTLSGGEAFMASLALALGLADAVREESGGFDLGTLFVDEGFGTLDDESLEQVISVLDSLREGGRAVGVVSHVGELRSRITSQLVVRKTANGSTVDVSTPGAESAA
ncbi:putative exonuclease [Janibacter sp. HTCC2649]|uniref:AAA family ATPase n=1 Tax=Janibacter sp. HTCC2649 TaxID=313589 RepID=UPI000066E9AF|nr:SMC family ATPase [Janibacter sp. HTCC2649]EAP99036.1 putative exonuclease [Janibacter sp. HTCC2649]